MKMEIERLRLNLSAAERDRALLSIGVDPATINPNNLLDEISAGRLCRIASSLALLGHVSVEDKIAAAIGLETPNDNVVDFWNVVCMGESCLHGVCEVRAEEKGNTYASSGLASAKPSQSILSCSQCKRRVCKVCCAGRGAILLSNHNFNTVSSTGSQQVEVSANHQLPSDGIICKQCCNDAVLHALMLDYLRVLISMRRIARADAAALQALNQVLGSSSVDCQSGRNKSFHNEQDVYTLRTLLRGEESLAEFPYASFLHPVWYWHLYFSF